MSISVGTLGEKLRGLAVLKESKKALETELDEVKGEITAQEKEIVTAMCDLAEKQDLEDPSNFSVVIDGRRYGLSVKTYFSIPAERKHEIYEALRDLGQGDLIQEKVDPRTLTKTLAEIMDANGGDLPEEYRALQLGTYDETKITDRKA